MDTFNTIKTRRSIRMYADKPIKKADLEHLIDAGRYATTARNVQPWEFIVVTERATLKKLGTIAEHGKFIGIAQACIVVFCVDTKYYLEDGSAATENILLAATALGIGSCWVAGDKKEYATTVEKLLGVPKGYKLVSLISLGYPKDPDALYVADKRTCNDVLHWEKF